MSGFLFGYLKEILSRESPDQVHLLSYHKMLKNLKDELFKANFNLIEEKLVHKGRRKVLQLDSEEEIIDIHDSDLHEQKEEEKYLYCFEIFSIKLIREMLRLILL